MSRSLVVVESPAKAKTIARYLGPSFEVKASVGHVMDLPKNRIGVDVEQDFTPEYEIIRGKVKILKEIAKASKEADAVYLAPDPDREGEAIAWHIASNIRKHNSRIYRILINEITKSAVLQAIQNAGPLNQLKFESQQARRILDRLVGYQISPLLWDKVRRGLSAGRVQSVAVRLVVDREREIQAFVSQEYWTIAANLEGKAPPPFEAKLAKVDGKKVEIATEAEARGLVQEMEGQSFRVAKVERKERQRKPQAPFITARLQQEASRKLRFTAKRTMAVAQQLYEGVDLGARGVMGLITYMRTDSTRVSDQAVQAVREVILQRFGQDYLPKTPNVYPSKKGAQDAHEAIRPTMADLLPDEIKEYLTPDQLKLYRLIWNRFVASQMKPALYDQTLIDVEAGRFALRASGSILKFPGFTILYVEGQDNGVQDEKDSFLPVLDQGDPLKPLKITPEQHFTQPPPRFTEATLVREMEENGIGRPSTYATIMSTIQDRDYARKEEGRFHPTDLGFLVTDLLLSAFPNILDIKFTADMESKLDQVEEGGQDWLSLLKEFYGPFQESLQQAKKLMRDVKREEIPTEHVCELCGKPMVIKWGRNGRFLACSGYPACRNTKEIRESKEGAVEIVQPEEATEDFCTLCGKPMIVKHGRFGRFLACSGYPTCKGTRSITTGVPCPTEGCDGMMAEKKSKKGRTFYSCTNYPKCKFALWNRPVAKACPVCNYPVLVEKDRKGSSVLMCPNEGCKYEEETLRPTEEG